MFFVQFFSEPFGAAARCLKILLGCWSVFRNAFGRRFNARATGLLTGMPVLFMFLWCNVALF